MKNSIYSIKNYRQLLLLLLFSTLAIVNYQMGFESYFLNYLFFGVFGILIINIIFRKLTLSQNQLSLFSDFKKEKIKIDDIKMIALDNKFAKMIGKDIVFLFFKK